MRDSQEECVLLLSNDEVRQFMTVALALQKHKVPRLEAGHEALKIFGAHKKTAGWTPATVIQGDEE